MIATHPRVHGKTPDSLVHCIDLCFDCAQACVSCADACLGEEMVAELRQCIRLDLDCADICGATGTLASRRTGSNDAVVRRLIEVCAEACRACERACRDAAATL